MKTKLSVAALLLAALLCSAWIDDAKQRALVRELQTRYYLDLMYADWFAGPYWHNVYASAYFKGRASSDYQSLVNLASVTGDDSIIPR